MKKTSFTAAILVLTHDISGCISINSMEPKHQNTPDTVVLAHGLGRSDWAMWQFAQKLEMADFKVCSLDYPSIGKSAETVINQASIQIDDCIKNTSKVHFVGHSLGGLVIRAYLQNNQQYIQDNLLGNVVLIGTPNKGSELADHFNGSWLMRLGGGISQALVTGNKSLGNNIEELSINLGVIAGTKPSSLTQNVFSGANDGLVSVESTKLKSMSDFITIEVGHSQMRYNLDVIQQTIHFVQKGRFKR